MAISLFPPLCDHPERRNSAFPGLGRTRRVDLPARRLDQASLCVARGRLPLDDFQWPNAVYPRAGTPIDLSSTQRLSRTHRHRWMLRETAREPMEPEAVSPPASG